MTNYLVAPHCRTKIQGTGLDPHLEEEMGRFRYVYVRWEELDLDPTSSPGSYVLQYLKLLEIFKKKYIDKIYIS